MKIVFVGNHGVSYSSENHHCKSLEALGHEIIRIQENKTNSLTIIEKAMDADLVVWIHTHGQEWEVAGRDEAIRIIKGMGKKVISYHLDLWMGIERQKDLDEDPFYKQLDYFFATDKLMADWFNGNSEVKGRYIPAGVYDEECYMAEGRGHPMQNDVIFVGSKGYHPEWSYRPELIDWLRNTYGSRFTHVGGDGDTGTIREEALNRMYAGSKIAIGDTLCLNFDYPYYFSDRLFESTGRGGFTIFPYIKGIENYFDIGKEIVTYKFGEFEHLKELIDYYLEHDEEREKIRIAGHERTKKDHTYKNRWAEILKEIQK